MATTKEYLDYVLDLLREVSGVSYKKMMGEYILYKNDVIFGGIYDNRFLLKITKSIRAYDLKEEIPYPGAKAMVLVDLEDSEKIKDIIDSCYKDLLAIR